MEETIIQPVTKRAEVTVAEDATIQLVIEKAMQPVLEKLANIEELVIEGQAAHKNFEERVNKLQDQIKAKESQIAEKEEECKRFQAVNENLERKVISMEQANRMLTEQVDAAKETARQREDEVSDKNAQIIDMQSENAKLKQELNIAAEENKKLAEKIINQVETVNVLRQDLSQKQTEILGLESIVETKENIISENKEALQLKDVKNNELMEEITTHQEEIRGLKEALGNKEFEKQELSQAINKKENAIEMLESALREERDLSSNLKAALDGQEEKNTQLQAEAKEQSIRINELQGRFGGFDEITKDYREIMDKAYACTSLEALVRDNKLETGEQKGSTNNILNFICVFGTEFSFAAKVYTTMRDYKKANRTTLTEEERTLMQTLNQYYKQRYEIEYDILDEVGFNADMKFDKQTMQDVERPSATDFRYAREIYVPALRSNTGAIQFKAVVKGDR